jgi:hypothetical protein
METSREFAFPSTSRPLTHAYGGAEIGGEEEGAGGDGEGVLKDQEQVKEQE